MYIEKNIGPLLHLVEYLPENNIPTNHNTMASYIKIALNNKNILGPVVYQKVLNQNVDLVVYRKHLTTTTTTTDRVIGKLQ